jgi:hypothetical protein
MVYSVCVRAGILLIEYMRKRVPYIVHTTHILNKKFLVLFSVFVMTEFFLGKSFFLKWQSGDVICTFSCFVDK